MEFDFNKEYEEKDNIEIVYLDGDQKVFDGLTFNFFKKGINENLYKKGLIKKISLMPYQNLHQASTNTGESLNKLTSLLNYLKKKKPTVNKSKFHK